MRVQYFKLGLILAVTVLLSACHSMPDGGNQIDEILMLNSDKNTELARIRTALAAQHITDGRLDEAKRQLDKAFLADTLYAPAYDMMGVLLQTESSAINLQKADGYFRKAIDLDGKFMQAFNNYGVYLARMGREHEAVHYFGVAAASLGYVGRIQSLENLGFTLQKLGDQSGAKQAFTKAIQAGSTNPQVREQLTHLMSHDPD
ncbi:pilus assembly protein PilW [Moraxella nasovis]|uniref:pilus assembly protein PilW n=1 Tax=Moraxella nasovis TaxID=2904121 RepID=UPI001F62283A|nr:pilus assembly protein PilW [Moraxella nasovis]UNU73557.1 pilus assembly protein PilW [Moraxella nasovis]